MRILPFRFSAVYSVDFCCFAQTPDHSSAVRKIEFDVIDKKALCAHYYALNLSRAVPPMMRTKVPA